VLRRIQHHKFEAITSVLFQPKTESEAAGIIVFRDEPYQYQLLISKENTVTTLSLIKVIPHEMEKQKKAIPTILATSAPLENKKAIKLRVVSDGPTFSFYYSENKKWIQVGDKVDAKHLSTEVAGGFIGTTIGMYATGNHY